MIAVIDYGLGNLRSVSKALESAGACVTVTNKPDIINNADSIVLPGVGAFYHGIKNLEELGLVKTIRDNIAKGKPFLGICLGLQLLFTQTEEHGIHQGLDIIKGSVKKFKGTMKIPHMGWNQIKIRPSGDASVINFPAIFDGIPDNSYFYFVHSYYVRPEDKDVIAASTEYGIEFASSIAVNNIFGVQFHPEKSSILGLKILKNFISIT